MPGLWAEFPWRLNHSLSVTDRIICYTKIISNIFMCVNLFIQVSIVPKAPDKNFVIFMQK